MSLGMSESGARSFGVIAAIVIATLFSMIAGELIPKNFALALPLATAKAVVPFQAAFTATFKPLIVFFNSTANRVVRSLGIEPKEELSGARSAEELSSLVRHSALAGMLDQDQAVLLRRSLEFSEHSANEVMTPRVRMSTVEQRNHRRRDRAAFGRVGTLPLSGNRREHRRHRRSRPRKACICSSRR